MTDDPDRRMYLMDFSRMTVEVVDDPVPPKAEVVAVLETTAKAARRAGLTETFVLRIIHSVYSDGDAKDAGWT